jgi:tetratricopeptide (TPR) repeat protein
VLRADGVVGPSGEPRATRADLLLAGLIAAAAYLLCASLAGGLRDAVGNFAKYPTAAAQLASGALGTERALDFSPLYLRLCAWLAAHAADPSAALLRVQSACAGGAAAALFLALRRHVGAPTALLGAGALVLYPGLLAHVYVFEPEAPMVLWLALTLLFAGRPGALRASAGGAALALCVLTRPGFWPLAAAVVAAHALAPGTRRLRDAAAFGAALALVWGGFSLGIAVAPPGPSTMNPGTVFYDGNGPLSEGVRAEYPALVSSLTDDFPGESDYQHALYRLVARRSEGRGMARGEVNRWWAAKALAFVADHPARWVGAAARKVFFALHAHRWHDLRVARLADDAIVRRLPPLPLAAPVGALALAGLALRRRRWREHLVAYAGFGLQLATMAAFYASERQRLSLWPFLCFFAALGFDGLRRRRRLGPALATALLVLPLSLDNDLTRDDRATSAAASALPDAAAKAAELRDQGRLREAVEAQARAMALAPWAFPGGARPERIPATGQQLAARAADILLETAPDTPTTRLHRALLLMDAGRLDAAEALLADLSAAGTRFVRRQGRVPDPDYWRALIASRRGDDGRAVALLEGAHARRPGDPEILGALAVLTGRAFAAARLGRYFDAADADWYQGVAALELGRPAAAVAPLRRAAALLPESRDLKVALAAALFGAGGFEEAGALYVAAMKLRPEPVAWESPVLRGLGGWAAGMPPGHFAHYLDARALRQFGRFSEARAELAAASAASGRGDFAQELSALDADIAAAGAGE